VLDGLGAEAYKKGLEGAMEELRFQCHIRFRWCASMMRRFVTEHKLNAMESDGRKE
jgi:hypothetical protein